MERDRERSSKRARPEHRDEKERPDQRVHRARGNEDELREVVEARVRRQVARSKEGNRHRHRHGEHGAEGGDVERVEQWRLHAVGIEAPRDRPHPAQHVADLRWGVIDEFRNHLHRLERDDDRCDDREIDREAREPFGGREPVPLAVDRGDPWRAHTLKICLMRTVSTSLAMISAMIVSTIAQTKSKSKRWNAANSVPPMSLAPTILTIVELRKLASVS